MTSLKISLLTATALSMMGGAALAQSNSAVVSQSGTDNELLVEQANISAGNNTAGLLIQPIVQLGDENSIDIEQIHRTGHPSNNTQFGNQVGTKGLGIDQIGNTNVLTILQDGYGLQAFEIQQSGGTGTASTSNSTVINQSGGRASISEVTQSFTGGATGPANTVAITQSGGMNLVGNTHTGPTNTGGVFQIGTGNSLDVLQVTDNHLFGTVQTNSASTGGTNLALVTQSGKNFIRSVSQTNTGAADNQITIDQSGTSNGSGSFLGAATAALGLTAATATQIGNGNLLSYVANGTANQFAFSQDGAENDITGASIGTNNEVAIVQTGAGNEAGFSQTGFGNIAAAEVVGDSNMLNLQQTSTVSGNRIDIAITGNDNNNWPVSPALSGNADTARDFATVPLVQGDLFQDGNGNSITLDVLSNANAFAMLQEGGNNSIAGAIAAGSGGNQAVVVQLNDNNSATFLQAGGGNNLGIVQGGSSVGNF